MGDGIIWDPLIEDRDFAAFFSTYASWAPVGFLTTGLRRTFKRIIVDQFYSESLYAETYLSTTPALAEARVLVKLLMTPQFGSKAHANQEELEAYLYQEGRPAKVEPLDGYTLVGPQWEQVYPQDAGDYGLLITGRNFRFFAQVDLYEKTLIAPPKLAYGFPGRLFYSRVEGGVRKLYSAQGTPGIYAGGPYPEASMVSDRSQLEKLAASGEWSSNLVRDVEASFGYYGQLEELAQLNAGDELTIINGSVDDCLIDSGRNLLWLQGSVTTPPNYLLRRLGTTLSGTIGRRLVEWGLDEMLATSFQEGPSMKEAALPITLVKNITDKSNTGKLDFKGPYGVYYREIFFHIPFLIANHLNSQQRFAAAQRWYHYIFNPTSDDTGDYRVWRYLEFRKDLKPGALREALTDPDALDAYRKDPFNPHAIARLRLSAYQKAVVMKYIDNLLDWGDSLFAEFTMESVNEATMLYTMAADILGPRPVDVGDCGEGQVSPKNYETVAPLISEIEEILIELEHMTLTTVDILVPNKNNFEEVRFGTEGVAISTYRSTAGSPVGIGMADMEEAVMGAPIGGGAAAGAPGIGDDDGPPSRPLDWRRTAGSYWTTTSGTDLRTFSSYGGGDGAPPALTPAGEDSNLTPPQIRGSYVGLRPWIDPGAPPGSLKPVDYKLPGVHDIEKPKPWEWHPIEGPGRELIRPDKPSVNLQNPGEMVPDILLFCIPENKELRAYWDRVEDRLRKIRNCMDITGASRQPALFSPEIDPRLLVRMRRAGLSLEDVLSVTSGSVPPYRFTFLIEKAKQYAGTVQSLGGALLSAMEKKDAEELGQLRTLHEQNLLKQRSRIMDWEIEAAEDTLESMRRQKQAAEYRRGYYEGLIQTGLIPPEFVQVGMKQLALTLQAYEVLLSFLSGGLSLVPQLGAPTAMKYGGHETGGSTIRFANGLQALAEISGSAADMAGLEASFARRDEEWDHQKKQADKEIANLDKQIEAAEIRLKIAGHSKEIHEKTIAQAEEVYEFYRDKFSSLGRYTYLSSMLNRRYREAYNTAFAAAKMAEQAFRFERPGDDAGLLTNEYWDASQAGLLAGERLLLDLQNLERRYLETNYRTLEIEQSFSLMQFDPTALLKLRQTGKCQFCIPEIFFDLSYPGHYLRRIRGVRLTIPCVAGPYTNVGAELQLDDSSIRLKPDGSLDTWPLRHTRVIAASSAQNDAGVFEFGFRDERYMPFEGAGAVSRWTLALPRNFRPFDYQTISDVMVRLSYTAEPDEGRREAVEKLAGDLRTALSTTGLPRLFSLRHEFPDVWSKLCRSSVGTLVDFELTPRHLPYLFTGLQEHRIGLQQSTLEVLLCTHLEPTLVLEVDGQKLPPTQAGQVGPDPWEKETDGLYIARTAAVNVLRIHTLKITDSGNLGGKGAAPAPAIDSSNLTDIILRVQIRSVPPPPPRA